MTTNGYHSLPSDSSAPSTRPSASSSASPTNDLRQSLMMDAAAHDVPLDTLTKPPQPPPQHKQLSVEPHFVSRFNHQSSISADIDAIRGTGIFSKLLPGPFWIKNIIGQRCTVALKQPLTEAALPCLALIVSLLLCACFSH